mmetsp:Transcript_32891/g.78026  ORF Transcript_32891/g.78026 Transcript_32891/m.78026 type:complete len:200 (+) Transcript_32891:46-645(+)
MRSHVSSAVFKKNWPMPEPSLGFLFFSALPVSILWFHGQCYCPERGSKSLPFEPSVAVWQHNLAEGGVLSRVRNSALVRVCAFVFVAGFLLEFLPSLRRCPPLRSPARIGTQDLDFVIIVSSVSVGSVISAEGAFRFLLPLPLADGAAAAPLCTRGLWLPRGALRLCRGCCRPGGKEGLDGAFWRGFERIGCCWRRSTN